MKCCIFLQHGTEKWKKGNAKPVYTQSKSVPLS